MVRWREALPDLWMDIKELFIEDDLATTRLTLTGTLGSTWAGAGPTCEKVGMARMMFFRLRMDFVNFVIS